MNELETYLRKQKTQIRRASINQFLTNKRKIFESIEKPEKHDVITHLQNLKRFVQYQSEGEALYQYLLNLHKIVRSYSIVSHICKKVELTDSPRLKLIFGQNYEEMTYLDLLVYLLRNNDSVPTIRELTYIIRYCIAQLSRNINQTYEVQSFKNYFQALKKTVQNYPFELLLHKDLEIIENIAIFLYNAVICSRNEGSTIYFLVNKLKPGILTYFNQILDNNLITNVAYIKNELITTILTLIFFINRYNLIQYQAEELNELIFKLKDIIIAEVLKGDSSQQFGNYCQFMGILCENKQLQIHKQEFHEFQNLIPKYIYQKSQDYFGLLQQVLFTHTYTLSPEHYEHIINYIFFQIADYKDYSPEENKFKIKLLNIFHLHLTNCGNRFHPMDAQVFVFCWGEYTHTDRLIHLINFLQSLGEKAAKILNIVCQAIVLILTMKEQLESCGVKLSFQEQQLNILHSFQQFRTALDNYGLEIGIQ